MKIKLVGFYDSLFCGGLRKLSSIVKQSYKDTELYLYSPTGTGSLFKAHFKDLSGECTSKINYEFLNKMKDADVIGLSSMSNYSLLGKKFIEEVKKINPSCYFVWGGAHGIMDPEACFPEADAVCVGEGEEAFVDLLFQLNSPEKKNLPGFWFKGNDAIIKNPHRPLISGEIMDKIPYPDFSDEVFYVDDTSLRSCDKETYLANQGNNYMTVWSQGCPFKCSYCSNTKFLENDKNYAKLRYPSPEYFVNEL